MENTAATPSWRGPAVLRRTGRPRVRAARRAACLAAAQAEAAASGDVGAATFDGRSVVELFDLLDEWREALRRNDDDWFLSGGGPAAAPVLAHRARLVSALEALEQELRRRQVWLTTE